MILLISKQKMSEIITHFPEQLFLIILFNFPWTLCLYSTYHLKKIYLYIYIYISEKYICILPRTLNNGYRKLTLNNSTFISMEINYVNALTCSQYP